MKSIHLPDNVPVVFHARDPDGAVRKYIPLADYEALEDAAIALCERMSALPQVSIQRGETALDLVMGTKVREP